MVIPSRQTQSIMKKLPIIIILGFFLSACKDDNAATPLLGDPNPPGTVSNVKITPEPGGANISYTLPKSRNLSYVVAEITTRQGQTRTFKSSFYTNQIRVEGLGDESEHEVRLYAVNGAEVRSEPVAVKFKPTLPPYLKVFRTLQLIGDFGGIRLTYLNPDKQSLQAILIGPDSLGRFRQINAATLHEEIGRVNFRGLKDVETEFGMYLEDHWGNRTDTMRVTLKPLFEVQLDKSKFRTYKMPNDPVLVTDWNVAVAFAFDGRWSSVWNAPYDGNGNGWLNISTDQRGLDPTWITFDMGTRAKLSRFRINHYYRYINRGMRKYEIWGSNDPAPDGSWDSWTKLVTYEQKKPSGLGYEVYNDADAAAWLLGDQADFPLDAQPMRYIRVRCLENWQGTGDLSFSEITLYGQPM